MLWTQSTAVVKGIADYYHMADDIDWRLQGQERYLHRAVLRRRLYRPDPEKPDRDHDHCEFCWAKFIVEILPDVLHTGYCTEAKDRWICDQCFADFSDRFQWTVSEGV